MTITAQVAEQITADIKRFGDDVKALNDDTHRALAEMRSEIDSAGKKVDPLVDEKVNKFAAEVEAKTAALESGLKATNDNLDKLGAVLKRPGANGGWATDEAAKEAKAAFAWHKDMLAAEGKLFFNSEIEPDVAAYAEYKKAHSAYIRSRKEIPSIQAALSTGSDPDGGYMVPTERSARVIEKVFETSALRAIATVETIAGKELIIPRDEGEFAFGGWVSETTAPTETGTSQFGESKIAVHEMFAEPRATQQMLEDAGFDVEGWIDRKVGVKFGRIEATSFFTGTGVNQPRGLLTYAAGTANGQIEQVNSGSAAAVTADGVYDLVFALKDFYLRNARFVTKRTTVRDLLKLKDGQGNYLWQMGDIRNGQPSTLLGYEVTRAEDMPDVAANALAIAFGDFGAAYTIVDRMGISLIRDNLTAKPWVKFYNRRRVGGDVVNFEAIKIQKIAA